MNPDDYIIMCMVAIAVKFSTSARIHMPFMRWCKQFK